MTYEEASRRQAEALRDKKGVRILPWKPAAMRLPRR